MKIIHASCWSERRQHLTTRRSSKGLDNRGCCFYLISRHALRPISASHRKTQIAPVSQRSLSERRRGRGVRYWRRRRFALPSLDCGHRRSDEGRLQHPQSPPLRRLLRLLGLGLGRHGRGLLLLLSDLSQKRQRDRVCHEVGCVRFVCVREIERGFTHGSRIYLEYLEH